MKFVYKDGEKDAIIRAGNELRNNGRCLLFSNDTEREYSLNFKVTDPIIAEHILVSLLNNEIEADIGIDITSINFEPYKSNERLKEELWSAINNVIG